MDFPVPFIQIKRRTEEYAIGHSCQIHVSWLKNDAQWTFRASDIQGGQSWSKFFRTKIGGASRSDPSSFSSSEGVFVVACVTNYANNMLIKTAPVSSPTCLPKAPLCGTCSFQPMNCEPMFLSSPTYAWLFSVYFVSLCRALQVFPLHLTVSPQFVWSQPKLEVFYIIFTGSRNCKQTLQPLRCNPA